VLKTLQRALGIACLVCAICAIYLSLRTIALPDVSAVDSTVKDGEPIQEVSTGRPFTTVIKGFTYALTPKATYDISGLVVSQHRGDALFNLGHKQDPGNIKDVCVVWGEAVTNGSYRKVSFSSGEFTCSFSWSGAVTPPFVPEKASNNHLIPANRLIAKQIRAIQVGDQIRMSGLLVDYKVNKNGQDIFTRQTSLTRGDTGNGACEILYVTDLSVVARGNHWQADAESYAWYTSLALFVALSMVWFVRPPLAE
jgi:hypothetical protein